MTATAVKSLHSINSGILDVRSGYETFKERAEPEILPVARELDAMHETHAGQVASLLTSIGEDTDDESVRGLVNKAANIVRDTFGDLDRDALSFVRQGEEQLLAVYDAALEGWPVGEASAAREVAQRQAFEIRTRIADLPQS